MWGADAPERLRVALRGVARVFDVPRHSSVQHVRDPTVAAAALELREQRSLDVVFGHVAAVNELDAGHGVPLLVDAGSDDAGLDPDLGVERHPKQDDERAAVAQPPRSGATYALMTFLARLWPLRSKYATPVSYNRNRDSGSTSAFAGGATEKNSERARLETTIDAARNSGQEGRFPKAVERKEVRNRVVTGGGYTSYAL